MEGQSADSGFSLERSEDRLLWIFGSSRSGSTWLLRMLSELEGAVPIDDPHLGHHLGVWRPIPLAWAAANADPELTILNEIKREKPSYFFSDRYRDVWGPALRELIVARFDAQARDTRFPAGADPLVIVKEPGSHIADLLMSLFRRSRMIFLLRDGRDVVDSWLAAHRSGAWALDEGAFPVAPQGREALIRWNPASGATGPASSCAPIVITTPRDACSSATRTSSPIPPASWSGSAGRSRSPRPLHGCERSRRLTSTRACRATIRERARRSAPPTRAAGRSI